MRSIRSLRRLVSSVMLLAVFALPSCGGDDDGATTGLPSGGGTGSGSVGRFNGDYGGTVSLTCPGIGTVSAVLTLSIANGTISVSRPQPGGGSVLANGDASMRVNNPSDVGGSSILSGTFAVGPTGIATGGGTWSERHVSETCSGSWAVQRG